MRAVICGSRDARDKHAVFDGLDQFDAETRIDCVIEGGQRTRDPKTRAIVGGVDYFASLWAYNRRRAHIREDADWQKHGHAAGPIRNAKMIREGKPDVVIAFPGGAGTADMCRQAEAAGIPIVRPSPSSQEEG